MSTTCDAHISQLLSDLLRLFDRQDSADVTLFAGPGKQQIFAHWTLLSARCEALRSISNGSSRLLNKSPPGVASDRCTVLSHIPGVVEVGRASSSSTHAHVTAHLPAFSAESVKGFVRYVYSGQVDTGDVYTQSVDVDSTYWVSLCALAYAFGILSLHTLCEHRLFSALPSSSLCSLLEIAVQWEHRLSTCISRDKITDGAEVSRHQSLHLPLVDSCVSRIAADACTCLTSDSFTRLSTSSLERLLSSGQMNVDAAILKRAVCDWARFEPGSVCESSPEANLKAVNKLKSVIKSVKLLLNDSHVTADQLFSQLPPSSSAPAEPKLFINSQLLKPDHERQLCLWADEAGLSSAGRWQLVFRASEHDWSASAFHRVCDNRAPLYVVCQGEYGQICGGFTDVPWVAPGCSPRSSSASSGSSRSGFSGSSCAFLFSLVNMADTEPVKVDVSKHVYAVCYHPQSGPVFGAGADLSISDRCNISTASYSNLPHSYGSAQTQPHLLFGTYNFSVLEYEVFTPTS